MTSRIFITLIGILFYFNLTLGQTDHKVLIPTSKFTINVDYSRFRYTETESYLEVYYAFYPSLITLVQDSGLIRGIIDMETIIRNKTTDSMIVDQRASIPVILNDTSIAARQNSFVSKLTFALPIGSYFLIIRAKDRFDNLRQDSAIYSIEIVNYFKTTLISDVDLCSNVISSVNKSSVFYKNSYEVIPNPNLYFGASGAPVVFTYAELYNLKSNFKYTVKAQVITRSGEVMKERVRTRHFNLTDAVDATTLNITSIPSGKYSFILTLSDSLDNLISRTEKPIYIFNPKVEPKVSNIMTARSLELAGLTEDGLLDEFRKLRYLAYSEDIKMFNKLTSIEAKREFIAKLWTSIENGERGRTDITRALYLDRIMTANQRYHSMGKEGWFTDRGRVYVLYAEPDQIERFPYSDNSKPYEVWQYFQIENGVQFVFIDRSGHGDYALVHSTKRGDIRDDNWEQYLR